MTKTTTARDALAKARQALQDDLHQLRDRIADLEVERRDVEQAPPDRATLEDRVAARIAEARAAEIFNRPQIFAPEALADPYLNRSMAERPFETLAAVCPDQLAQAMLAHHPGGGLGDDERLARLDRIDRDLRAAAIAEEQAARELEAATGATVPRRLSAPAEVVLAPDAELEGDQ